MSKITLITGVAGTTGSQILDYLSVSSEVLKGDRTIIGIDNYFRGTPENLTRHVIEPQRYFKFIKGDFESLYSDLSPLTEDEVSRIDEVYHMAAVVPTKYFYESPDLTYEVNCKGTIDLFDWCRRKGIKRFIVGSSSEIYGHIREEDLPAKETTMSHYDSEETSTRWSYAEGKILTEHYLNHFADEMERVCHLRFANTYGPRDLDDNHVLPYLVRCVVSHECPHLNKDANNFYRTFLNNHDSARACVELMKRGHNGVAYNVGSEEEVSISELFERVKKIGEEYGIDSHDLESIRDIDRPGDPRRRVLDTTRLHEHTGFKPEVSLDEGLRQMFNKILKGVEGP